MASLNSSNSFKTTTTIPVLENNNDRLSRFKKRNKMAIIVLTSLVVCLTLIIGALIAYLFQEDTQLPDDKSAPRDNPVIFYSAPCNAPPCWRMYNTIITTKYVMDPARIFQLTLQKSIEDLENLISLIDGRATSQSIDDDDDKTAVAALNNCSDSLRGLSSRIQSIFRINPLFFGEKMDETVERMMGVEGDLEACVGDVAVREKVLRVKEYLRSCRENLLVMTYNVVWEKFWAEFVAKWGMMFRSLFLMCVGGLQLLFMFFLFWTLFKFRCR